MRTGTHIPPKGSSWEKRKANNYQVLSADGKWEVIAELFFGNAKWWCLPLLNTTTEQTKGNSLMMNSVQVPAELWALTLACLLSWSRRTRHGGGSIMIMTSRLSKHIPFHCWQILTGGVSLVVWEQLAFPDSEGTQIRFSWRGLKGLMPLSQATVCMHEHTPHLLSTKILCSSVNQSLASWTTRAPAWYVLLTSVL